MRRRRELATVLPGTTPDPTVATAFLATAAQVVAAAPTLGGGIYLGQSYEVDEAGDPDVAPTLLEPARADLFGTRNRTAVVAGRPDLGRLLALRAAACGAAVVVVTDRPEPWGHLVERVSATQPFATVVGPGASWEPPADGQPLLLVVAGATPETVPLPPAAGPRCVMWLPDPVGDVAFEEAYAGADLVFVEPGAAAAVSRVVEMARMPARMTTVITGLEADQVLVRSPHATRVVRVGATDVERSLLIPVGATRDDAPPAPPPAPPGPSRGDH